MATPAPVQNTPAPAPAVDTTYFKQPTETVDAYNARISSYNASKAPAAPGTPAYMPSVSSSDAVRNLISQNGIPADQVPKDSSMSFSDFAASVIPSTPAPTPPSYVDKYQQMRIDQGIPALEDQALQLQQQQADAQKALIDFKAKESGAGESESFYTGRVSEAERNVQARLDSINLQMGVVQQSMSIKNNFISTMMDLTQKDYAATSDLYNKQFTQNLQVMNAFNMKSYRDMTLEERAGNDARAKLATMQNILSTSGTGSIADVLAANPDLANGINQLEMQAGLPVGFMQTFSTAKPGANVIAHFQEQDQAGKYYITTLSKNPDGTVSSTRTYTGVTGKIPKEPGTTQTAAEKKDAVTSNIDGALSPGTTAPDGTPYLDASGHLTKQGFQNILKYGTENGLSRKVILDNYSSYLSPNDLKTGGPNNYGLTDAEKAKYQSTSQ